MTELTRMEKHYIIEAMISFLDRYGREMTDEEYQQVVEKIKNKKRG